MSTNYGISADAVTEDEIQEELEENGYLAPDGTIFVCGACGKRGHDRTRMGDTSCFTHAVLCYNPPNVQPDGRPAWMAVPEEAFDARG